MSAPSYRATDTILCGLVTLEAGDLVPATYTGTLGEEHPVDFERLLALGVVENVAANAKHAAAPNGAPAGETLPTDAPSKPTRKRRKAAAK
jgi:hypothetical protein